jgi:Zn-dependent metalloprotease
MRTRRKRFNVKAPGLRIKLRSILFLVLAFLAIPALMHVWFESSKGKAQSLPSAGEVQLPAKTKADRKSIFSKGSANEIKKAREISLDFLATKIRSRNVGTLNDFKVEKVEIDDSQMAHTRMRQTVGGIPVWEGEVIVHLNSDGSLFTITDNLKESISVNVKPDLLPDEAVQIAERLYTGSAKQSAKPSVELWIYRGDESDYLVYRVVIPRVDGTNDSAIPVDFIDAHTGKRVFGYDNLQTGTGVSLYNGTVPIGTSSSGSTFFMENLSRRTGTFDAGNAPTLQSAFRLTDSDDFWNSSRQQAGVDAQYGADATMNYYQTVHGRNGIDGSGGPGVVPAAANGAVGLISSFVHFGSNYNNAAWLFNDKVMIYGDGDGDLFSPLVSLDVCGHELTHGVTQHTANLTYEKESGALNESMSDVMGVMVERFQRPATWNWQLGEQVYTPHVAGDAMRYMDNPHINGMPDHYSLRLFPGACIPTSGETGNDQCGVHTNSSIANHAFYLVAAGGTNRVSGISVSGIGPDNAARIWYRALTSFMTQGTDFAGARQATLDAASALFGSSSSQFNSVATGWCAVGVGVCPGSGGGTCPATPIALGQTINGALAATDCVFTGTTKRVDLYSFSGTAGQQITISMSSSFDTYLYLINSSNQLLAEDDDGGGGTNSRIPTTSGFITLPSTGTFTIYATSFSDGSLGPYSLSLTSGGGSCPSSTISVGQTLNGSLASTDCILAGSNRNVDVYTFTGSTGQRVGVQMNSTTFDTYLYLVNSSSQVLAEDDDSGGGTNSRVPNSSAFFTLPANGTYSIWATSFSAGSSGTYSLSLVTEPSMQFSASTSSVSEVLNATTPVNLTVTRTGGTASAASVNYATANGTASDRSDYLAAAGTLNFAAGETSKTVSVFIVDDRLGESSETFTVSLSNPVGCTLGSPSVSTVTINSNESVSGLNPVKDASFNSDFFVREHYIDFLNREADPSGLAFWKDQIDSCTTQSCREIRRINVSAAFFLSIEFQQTGFLVERLYKAAYGNGVGTSTLGGVHQISVPIVRLNEFLTDTQQIGRGVVIGQPGADQLLANNQQVLVAEFIQRSRFLAAFPTSMTQAQFVDKLNANAGGVLSASERSQLINDLSFGGKTRAQVLRAVAEDPDLINAETNRAFVLTQYFGYLRRNPNDTPDPDYTGFDFWLGKLNQFNGNFVSAEMVKAFIVSGEYQGRFGP